MSALRILEIITPSKVGGAEIFVMNLCKDMPSFGHDVRIFCPAGRPFINHAAKRGLKCISWRTCGKADPVTVLRLIGLIKRERIEVVHTHLSTASLLGAFAARATGIPAVAHVHGLNTATCFRYSSAVVAVSEAVKRHLCNQGLSERKIRVVHNGVDLDRFHPAPLIDAKLALGFDPTVPLIGIFGRLSAEKGQRVALEAMFLLLKEHPRARLILVGDGPDIEELRECIDALGIRSAVEFAGFALDVRPILFACDVVLVPSLKEGFGLAAVEAMAAGKPVVASSVGGLTEIVEQNETGFLVEPNNPSALAEATGMLIANPELAQRMGRSGRKRAEQFFDFRKQAAEVLAVLSEAAQCRLFDPHCPD